MRHTASAPACFDIAAHPGFDIAQAWYNRHKQDIAELLSDVADQHSLFPDGDLDPDNSFDAFIPARLRRDTLPCELLLILALARAIKDAGGRRPGGPARLTVVNGWADLALMTQLQEMLCKTDLDRAFLSLAEGETPDSVIFPQPTVGERGQAERRKSLTQQISKALLAGRTVLAFNATRADLPYELRCICSHELRLPQPDGAMITALLALLFPQHAHGALTPEALPPEAALARLTPLQLITALHARRIDEALATLHRLTAPPQTDSAPGSARGLDVVAGQAEAVKALRRLAADITAWRAGALDWSAVPRSMIFHGPPGTGKTYLAQAFTAETGLPLIATSFAECQKSGHMGDMLAALDAAASEAEARAPAVFFLDELDGFSSRNAESIGRNSGYMRAVITGLLKQLDRLIAIPGVVLIGATNDLEAVDPAIRREGRFDSKMRIDPPDRLGMAQILRDHLGAADMPELRESIALAAERLVGTSGAAAAALARAARARQRETGASQAAALLAELDARHPAVATADQRRVALHEAGHVVVGVLSGMATPTALRLTPRGGEVHWPAVMFHTRATALVELRMLLGGHAAEQVFFGAPSSSAGVGPASDLAQATRLAQNIECEWGMGDGGLTWHPGLPVSMQHMPWLRTKLDHLLTTAASQARAIIATNRDTVEALADELLEAREMKGEVLQDCVARIRAQAPSGPSRAPSARERKGVIPMEPR